MTKNRILSCSHGFSMRKLLKPLSVSETSITFKNLWKSEWSPDFEELRRHRLVQGALRYGLLNSPGKKQFNRPKDVIKRMELYIETHNMEHLVDGANLCMLEFEEGIHPDRHFQSHDDQIHTEEK